MDVGTALGIIVPTALVIIGGVWLLANKISDVKTAVETRIGAVQSAFTETTHAIDLRVAKVESARKAEDTAARVTDLERAVERLALTRCDKCPAFKG